jgi:hypothetical protein
MKRILSAFIKKYAAFGASGAFSAKHGICSGRLGTGNRNLKLEASFPKYSDVLIYSKIGCAEKPGAGPMRSNIRIHLQRATSLEKCANIQDIRQSTSARDLWIR